MFSTEESQDTALNSIFQKATQEQRTGIRNFFRKFILWIKEKLGKTSYTEQLELLEDKWINLIKNSEATEETGAVKYEIKHDKNGNKYWQIETENDIFKNLSTISEYEEAAFNYILNARDNNTVIHAIDGKNMKFIRLSAEEFTNSEYSKELKVKDSETYKRKMRMLPSIEKIHLNANVNWQSPDFKEHKLFKKRGFENFRGRVRIDNVIFNTVVRAGKAKFGDVFYDINLEVDQILPHGNTASEIKRSTSNDSISNNPENVKKKYSISPENIRYNQERYVNWLLNTQYKLNVKEDAVNKFAKELKHISALDNGTAKQKAEARELLDELSKKMADEYNVPLIPEAQELLRYIRNTKFSLTETQKQEARDKYGSVTNIILISINQVE